VHGLIASSPSGDWTYGAAILTFAFPVALFIVVASALYILYTKPHLVPGHKYNMVLSSASDTPVAGTPRPVGTAEQPPASGAEG
jgi:hypothetical protein